MNNILLSFLMICGLAFYACDDDSDSTPNPEPAKDYSGVWNGEYEGGDNGFLQFTVAQDNSITGRGYSSNVMVNFTLSGNLNTDVNLPGAESTLKITYVGQFSDSTASGTWSNASGNLNGTWYLEK